MATRITLFTSGGYVCENIDDVDPSLPSDPCATSCQFACPAIDVADVTPDSSASGDSSPVADQS